MKILLVVNNTERWPIAIPNVDDRPLINPVRQGVFGPARPASTLVEVPRLAVPGAKVEIECVAVIP